MSFVLDQPKGWSNPMVKIYHQFCIHWMSFVLQSFDWSNPMIKTYYQFFLVSKVFGLD